MSKIKKFTIIKSAEEHLPCMKLGKRSKWLSKDTLAIANKRREAKAKGNRTEAQRLNWHFK